jgi:nitrogen-specific signal transduction histidine kinase
VTGKRRGTGLGLAITRNIVDALGGTIVATSLPGAGTEIRIELPERPPAADAGGRLPSAADSGGARAIESEGRR